MFKSCVQVTKKCNMKLNKKKLCTNLTNINGNVTSRLKYEFCVIKTQVNININLATKKRLF